MIMSEQRVDIEENVKRTADDDDDDDDDDVDGDLFRAFMLELDDKRNFVEISNILITLHNLSRVIGLITSAQLSDVLLPKLKTIIDDTYNEQIHYEIALQFDKSIPALSHIGDFHQLLDIYAKLLSSDEAIVRDVVINTLIQLNDFITDEIVNNQLVGFLIELANREWTYAKFSAVELFPVFYAKLTPENQLQIKALFMKYLSDQQLHVRKATAINFVKFVSLNDKEFALDAGLSVFDKLVEDSSDAVRAISIDLANELMKMVDEDVIDEKMGEMLNQLAGDSSWKVRSNLADKLPLIQLTAGPRISRLILLPIIEKLTVDKESLVREKLAGHIPAIYTAFTQHASLDEELEDRLIAVVKTLHFDTNLHVQHSLASNIIQLAAHFSRENIAEILEPIVMQHVQNLEHVTELDVRNINQLIGYVGYQHLQEQIERVCFDVLTKSEVNWRCKRSLLFTILVGAENSNETTFLKSVVPFYHKMLNDPIFAIRRLSPLILPGLIAKFGVNLLNKNVLNRAFGFVKHPSYKFRYVALHTIDVLLNMRYDDLNRIVDELIAFKLQYLCEKLESKLADVAAEAQQANFFLPDDDVVLYAEDTLPDFLAVNTSHSLSHEQLIELLIVLIRAGCKVIVQMSSDKIENVRGLASVLHTRFGNFKNALKTSLSTVSITNLSDDVKEKTIGELDDLLLDVKQDDGGELSFMNFGKSFQVRVRRRSRIVPVSNQMVARIEESDMAYLADFFNIADSLL